MSETVFPSTVTFQFPLYFCEIYTEFFLRFIYFLMVAIFPSSVKWKKWKDQWNIYKWTWKTEKQTIWISSNFHKTIFLSSLSFSVSIFFKENLQQIHFNVLFFLEVFTFPFFNQTKMKRPVKHSRWQKRLGKIVPPIK